MSEGPEEGRAPGEDGYVWRPPTGARPKRGFGRSRSLEPESRPLRPPPPPLPDDDPLPEPGPDADDTGSATVRPYFFTKGRTRSAVDLEIETLLSAVRTVEPPAGPTVTAWELCHETRSVAEVAALMRVPLGVARVLLGDLAAAGSVVVHQTVDAEGPALTLLQRVLSGLRNL